MMAAQEFGAQMLACFAHIGGVAEVDADNLEPIRLDGKRVFAIEDRRGGVAEFDIVRIGVAGKSTVRLEIRQRWTRDRIAGLALGALGAVILLGVAFLFGLVVGS